MNQSTTQKQNFVSTAHQLRRDYLAALVESAFNSLSAALRKQHERALRHASRQRPRLRNLIGMPA